ncbi:major facilitator superfamily domain-containing protein [Mycena filopes]|nr:major facilitator superfamily domain-containing protein [Mycena filopes]
MSLSALSKANLHPLPEKSSVEKQSEVLDPSTSVTETTVCGKLDWHILPVLTMMLLLAFLDRNNIGNARVSGLQEDLKMSNYELTSCFPNYSWPDTGFVRNYSGLIVCRCFLGLFEGPGVLPPMFFRSEFTSGGLLPGMTLYFASFYPRDTLQLRIAVIFATSSLAGAFSGLLASAIVKLDGARGLHGWAWIFILEGIFTVIFGLSAFFMLPRTLEDANFLNHEHKEYLKARLAADGMTNNNPADQFNWADSPHVLLISVAGFFGGSTQGGLAYFEPSIVQSLGYGPARTQLMSVPPFAVAFILSLVFASISDRFHCRGLTAIVCALLSVIGFAMWLGSSIRAVRYGSLFLSLPGAYCAAPALGAWNANNIAPYTRRATALALLTISTNAGGILATWLLGSLSRPPNYTKAALTFTIFSAGGVITAGLILWYLVDQNHSKATKRATNCTEDNRAGFGDRNAWFIYSL